MTMENEVENMDILERKYENYSTDKKTVWIPFLRQLSIAMGIWTLYFMNGLIMGSPTVVIPQLRREMNDTTKFNEDFTPWLSSVFGIGGIPWVFILPYLLEVIGRKYTYIVISVITLIGFIVFYCSNTVIQILISELILGILTTALQTVSSVTLMEYTSPCYRGIFLTIKSASFLWGVWVANAIGAFIYWKNIGILALVCCSFTLTGSMWPESPYWLASKGRFKECAKAHRWLKGINFESEQELTKLIESQTQELNKAVINNRSYIVNLYVKVRKMIFCPEFYKPILLSMLILIQYHTSGKLVCTMYAIDIVKKITNNEASAYRIMLSIDGITVLSAYIGSASSKILKRRTLMIASTSVATLFLFILSLYLYLVKFSILIENDIVLLSLLTVYSIAISSGSLILLTCIMGELLPLRFKSWSILVIALFANTIHFSSLRSAPELFKTFGLHGSFLFYGIGSTIALCLFYVYVPETKDRTLQEIEESFKRSSDRLNEHEHSHEMVAFPLVNKSKTELNDLH